MPFHYGVANLTNHARLQRHVNKWLHFAKEIQHTQHQAKILFLTPLVEQFLNDGVHYVLVDEFLTVFFLRYQQHQFDGLNSHVVVGKESIADNFHDHAFSPCPKHLRDSLLVALEDKDFE